MGHLYLDRWQRTAGPPRRVLPPHPPAPPALLRCFSFVEHFRNAGFKRGLRGTVRMETPVIYLYDSREETVSVKVAFSKGVITEWYPRASRVEPAENLFDGTLYQQHPDGSITWDSVTLAPLVRAELP